MADLLRFRKGLYSGLKTITPTANTVGTIYVTTDEQAMYVDIEKSSGVYERIRLGETVHFATLQDFQAFLNATEPPYDTRAFYYVEGSNALLKWVPSGGGYQDKGNWKQINSTAHVEALIAELRQDLTDLDGVVAGLNTILNGDPNVVDDTGLVGRVDNLYAELDTADTGIKARLTAVEQVADTNKKAIGEPNADGSQAGKTLYELIKENADNITANDEDISDINDALKDHQDRIEVLEGKVGAAKDTSNTATAFERIESLEEALGTGGGTGETILDRVKSLEGTTYDHGTRIGTLETDLDAAEKRLDEAEDELERLEKAKLSTEDFETEKQALEQKIAAEINAANAMNYKGSVGSVNELPSGDSTERVKIGDTYVVSKEFSITDASGETKTAHAGDLLVANSIDNLENITDNTTGETFIDPSTLIWNHVDTGYIEAHENKIVADGNTLKLQTYTDEDISKITFAAEGAAKVKVETDASSEVVHTVTVSVEWEDF